MVANAVTAPRQLSLLDAPPVVSDAAVLRLLWFVRRLSYGDSMVSGSFRLERQCFQRLCDCEDDAAPDGALVTGSYVEFIVFAAGRKIGAVEVRTAGGAKIDGLHGELARWLLNAGWPLVGTRLMHGGAVSSPDMNLNRVKRILKIERR